MGHGHGRKIRSANDQRASSGLKTAFTVTFVIFLLELIGGVFTHSLALISDSFHMLADVVALFLAWFTLKLSCRLPTKGKTFGYHRTEIFAALVNGIMLLVIVMGIFYEGVRRLMHPEAVESHGMLIIAAIGLAANLFVMLKLRKHDDLNIKAAFMHVLGDTISSVAVIFAAIWIKLTGQVMIDSLLSIAISVFIGISSLRILKDALNIFLEGTPKNIDVDKVIAEIMKVAKVKDVHSVHVWAVCSNINVMSAHLLVDENEICKTEEIIGEINHKLKKFRIKHTTFQVESSGCRHKDKFRHLKH